MSTLVQFFLMVEQRSNPTTLSEAKSAIARRTELELKPEDKRTHNEETLLRYYRELTREGYPRPAERTLQEQEALLGMCPFYSKEYKTELLNLFDADLDENDPKNNRVRLLRAIGNFAAYIVDDAELVDEVLTKLDTEVTSKIGRQTVLTGVKSCLGENSGKLEDILRFRWDIK